MADNEMEHPLTPENQERYGINDGGVVGAFKNYIAHREDNIKHYKDESYLAGFSATGLADEDYYTAMLENREEMREGRKIYDDQGNAISFTREAVAEKIAQGYKIVNVNFEKQRTAKLYSYLTKEPVQRGGTAQAPFTYSPDFNPTLAGKNGLANVVIKSINSALRSIMGQSANLESQGKSLKVIGGGRGDIFQSGGFTFGGARDWRKGGQQISIGMSDARAAKQAGQNATQVIS